MADLAEREYYDEILGPPIEPDEINNIRWIGKDKAEVNRSVENPHWSQLPKPVTKAIHRKYGDNDKSDPFNNIDEEA